MDVQSLSSWLGAEQAGLSLWKDRAEDARIKNDRKQWSGDTSSAGKRKDHEVHHLKPAFQHKRNLSKAPKDHGKTARSWYFWAGKIGDLRKDYFSWRIVQNLRMLWQTVFIRRDALYLSASDFLRSSGFLNHGYTHYVSAMVTCCKRFYDPILMRSGCDLWCALSSSFFLFALR